MGGDEKVNRREENKQFISRIDLTGFSCYAAAVPIAFDLLMSSYCFGMLLLKPSNMANSGIQPTGGAGCPLPRCGR
jgi:hypothetical protein